MQLPCYKAFAQLLWLGLLIHQLQATGVKTVTLPSHTVFGQNDGFSQEVTFDPQDHPLDLSPSLPERLLETMELTFLARGMHSKEPNLGGFSGERVGIYFNGLRLPDASPTRTGSAINFISPAAISQVEIQARMAPVSKGPLTIGGRVDVQSFPLVRDKNHSTYLNAFHASNTNAKAASFSLDGGNQNLAWKLSASTHDNDAMVAGDGTVVDAQYRARSGSFATELRNDRHTLQIASSYYHQDVARNSSLPMDTKDASLWATTLNHTWISGAITWKNHIGWSVSEVFLSAEDRIRPPSVISITAQTRTSSQAASSAIEWDLSPLILRLGLDTEEEKRDATRRRELSAGAFDDRLWPDLVRTTTGAFAEMELRANHRWIVRSGVRVDRVASDAYATETQVPIPAARGDTILQNYQAYSGDSANRIHATETTGSWNLALWRTFRSKYHWRMRTAWSRTPAGVTQQYRSFVNALGGNGSGGVAFEIGNPGLRPEKKWDFSSNLSYQSKQFSLALEAWHAQVNDFIRRQVVTPQGQPTVYSFRNIDAVFHGLQISGQWTVKSESLSIPFALNAMTGETENGDRLVEIPPWTWRCGIQKSIPFQGATLMLEGQYHYTAARTNPSPLIMPIYENSGGYQTLDFGCSLTTVSGWTLSLRLLNALDQTYYSYLQPPVADGPQSRSSELAAGDRIPGPGRDIQLSLSLRF
jgi:hypothetical protein